MAKKTDPQDWHKEDIKAAIRKAGTNMNELARQHGYMNLTAIRQALQHSYPKTERIIAAAIGVSPETIWPSRYKSKYRVSRNAGKVNLTLAV